MAGAVVHNEFFKECISKSTIQQIDVSQTNLNLYAQGHDLLLYYQLLNFKNNRNISLILSNFKFQDFIYNYLKIAIENSSIYQDDNIKAFLYGYISHHVLDSYFHPFIMQYEHDYLPVRNKPWLHGKIESLYDTYFIVAKKKLNVSSYKIYQDFGYCEVEDDNFINNIEDAMRETYGINNIGFKISEALKTVENYIHLYRYDPKGLKKLFAKLTDPIVGLGAQDFFYEEELLPQLEKYMNKEHNLWQNLHSHEVLRDSFDDIYRTSVGLTMYIISEIENILQKNYVERQNIMDVVPDRSAITGDVCGKPLSYIRYGGK